MWNLCAVLPLITSCFEWYAKLNSIARELTESIMNKTVTFSALKCFISVALIFCLCCCHIFIIFINELLLIFSISCLLYWTKQYFFFKFKREREEIRKRLLKEKNEYRKGFWNAQCINLGGLGREPNVILDQGIYFFE